MKKALWGLIIFVILLPSCATTQTATTTTIGKSMLVAKEAIVSTAESVNTLCSAGTLNQRQCDEAKNIYEQAQPAYELARISLETAIKSGGSDTAWANFETAHQNFMVWYLKLVDLATKYQLIKN